MYVTRPLSLLRKHPSALTKKPDDEQGPYSGYLVITDEEAETQDTSCWGLCKNKVVEKLPFPSDKIFRISYFDDNFYQQEISATKVFIFPVLDQPLSSNRYHVIRAKGKYKGQAYISSREQEIRLCWCFPNPIHDSKPRPFDFRNLYQQFKFHRHHHSDHNHNHNHHTFTSTSTAHDGVPPNFLRKKGWEIVKTQKSHHLRGEALGLDVNLRSNPPTLTEKEPNFNVVEKWYCPFVFIKEELRMRHQMGLSPFYEMTLQQSWEVIYLIENVSNQSTALINVDVKLKRRVDWLFGMEAKYERNRVSDHLGFVWFRVYDKDRGVVKIGLSVAIVEKIKWIQEEGGWFMEDREEERIERVVEVSRKKGRESGVWKRLGCYVLVESFILRRMDGVVVLKSDFRHTHKIQCKCEM